MKVRCMMQDAGPFVCLQYPFSLLICSAMQFACVAILYMYFRKNWAVG
jgi:hypothetical protein